MPRDGAWQEPRHGIGLRRDCADRFHLRSDDVAGADFILPVTAFIHRLPVPSGQDRRRRWEEPQQMAPCTSADDNHYILHSQ
jgi:hypothetical protein